MAQASLSHTRDTLPLTINKGTNKFLQALHTTAFPQPRKKNGGKIPYTWDNHIAEANTSFNAVSNATHKRRLA